MKLLTIGVIVLLFNIPFGYWRANVRKFSLQWILSIHIPVPFIIALRFLSGIGFAFITYPVLVGSFFLGQFGGKIISSFLNKKEEFSVSSCMVCDFYKLLEQNKKQ